MSGLPLLAALPITRPGPIIFAVGLVAYIAVRHHHEGVVKRATAGETSRERRLDAIEVALLVFVMLGSVLVPLTYLFTSWYSAFEWTPPLAVPIAGGVLMLGSLLLFHRAHADLGKQWSATLEIRADHRLITDGVYRRVRHPMYTAIWGFAIAQALLLPNTVAGFSAVASIAPLYFVRTPREEALMRETFGEEYDAYTRRTGRLFPRIFGAPRDDA